MAKAPELLMKTLRGREPHSTKPDAGLHWGALRILFFVLCDIRFVRILHIDIADNV